MVNVLIKYEEKSLDETEVACSAVSHMVKHTLYRTTLFFRVGRALLALTLINQHGRAVRSAVQTALRTTSSRGDTDLMHWNSDVSSRRRRLSDSTSRYVKLTLIPVPLSIPHTHSLTYTITHLYV